MKVLLIARFTLREATRKKAVMGGVLLTVGFLILYAVGTFFAFREMNVHFNGPASIRQSLNGELLLSGIYFVNFIAGLLAIFSSVGTISTEIEQGTLHAIVPKPLHRWQIVAGKWLGFAVMLAGYAVFTALSAMVWIYLQSGFFPPNPVAGIALIVLHALLLLSLSMLGTSALSTVTNGIVVFMLYALSLAGGRLEQLGSLIRNDTLINIGITTSLIIPTDALWRLASSLLGGGGFLSGAAPGAQPGLFTVVDPPSNWMVAYALAYAALALIAAVLVFRRRDL